jgi:hypothetical protein
MLRGYQGILVGLEVAPPKGVKYYGQFCLKKDIAFAELLISSKSDVYLGNVHASRTELMPEGIHTFPGRALSTSMNRQPKQILSG